MIIARKIIGRVDTARRERRRWLRPVVPDVVEEHAGIRAIDRPVIIRIGSGQTRRRERSEKNVVQDCYRVGVVDHEVIIGISANEHRVETRTDSRPGITSEDNNRRDGKNR